MEAELADALRELIHQIDLSNAVDDHGHQLKNLKALAYARRALNDYDEPRDPPGFEGGFADNH